jgi:hypothetical protein
MANKIKTQTKLFCTFILISLVISSVFTVLPASALPAVASAAKVNLTGSKTITLTAADIASMPTYTGVGSPRRSGGVFPLQMLGNYTGVPLMYLCNLVGGISSSSIVTVSTTKDGFTATLTYDMIHDNNYPQYNISTHEVISGQQPIMILAYGINGTTLTSDGTDSDTDLGGPLRVFVVSNNGTSPLLINDGLATFGNSYVKFVTDIVITNPGSLTFETCDSSGTAKSAFNPSDNIYFSSTGLKPSTTYPVYIVQDRQEWTVRIPMPTRITGTATIISTDSSGKIAPISVFSNAQAGHYAIIVDVNSDGKYDEADLLIDNVEVTGSESSATPTSSASTTTPTPTTSTGTPTSPTLPASTSATPTSTTPATDSFPNVSTTAIIVIVLLMVALVVLVVVKKKVLPASSVV